LRNTLYTLFGTREVATLYTASNQFPIITEVEPRFQREASDLSRVYLRGSSGQVVPLDSVASVRRTVGRYRSPISSSPR
jgi:HAE1 family hydrophobic/amphiphilic exporter-1